MNIQSVTGTLDQVAQREAQLRKEGFVLRHVSTSKDLSAGEYFKNSFVGNERSPVGPAAFTITWRPRGAV